MYLTEGNAYQTVKSNDEVKVITVRGTAFEAAEEGGGSAGTEPGKCTQKNLLHCCHSIVMAVL